MPQMAAVANLVHECAVVEARSGRVNAVHVDDEIVGQRPDRASALALDIFNDEGGDRKL
jgi:hypothetical protein